jgi:hypothetical protein
MLLGFRNDSRIWEEEGGSHVEMKSSSRIDADVLYRKKSRRLGGGGE